MKNKNWLKKKIDFEKLENSFSFSIIIAKKRTL